MAIKLVAPKALDFNSGISSIRKNPLTGGLDFTLFEAEASGAATTSYYVIYQSDDANTLFDHPRYIAANKTFSLPVAHAVFTDFYGARPAQFGLISNLESIGSNLFLFPNETSLSFSITSTTSPIKTQITDTYPADGYLKIEREIISYSAVSEADGYLNFTISNRDPFAQGTATNHSAGTSVTLFKGIELLNNKKTKPVEVLSRIIPTWQKEVGIVDARDLGVGTQISLEWSNAIVEGNPDAQIFYNVYIARNFTSLFTLKPFGITTKTSAIVNNLSPGDGYSFAVRAMTYPITLSLENLDLHSNNFYLYPDPLVLEQDISLDFTGNAFISGPQDKYPDNGFAIINKEIVKYEIATDGYLNIISRSQLGVGTQSTHSQNDEIILFKGLEDYNNYVLRQTPSWDAFLGTRLDGYNQYMQDEDGYRAFPEDVINQDLGPVEEVNSDFREIDYCGHRSQLFHLLYSRQQCGTYIGGRINGFAGGIDAFEANIQRQEMQLSVVGTPFILLKRKRIGRTCPLISHRAEHPHYRCGVCFGTSFEGGYDRFQNTRPIRPGDLNPNGFIMCRISPYKEDNNLTADRGLAQNLTLTVWTMAIPVIKERDILVRYQEDPVDGLLYEEFRYEVLDVGRNEILMGKPGKQDLSLRRIDKTDDIYTFPVDIEV